MSKFTIITAATLLAEVAAGGIVAPTRVTHDGPRHADETLALAREVASSPGAVRVCFTRDKGVLGVDDPLMTFVDVGGAYDPAKRRFDHHFAGAPCRADGLPYSSFGLLVRKDGEEEANSPLVRHVDALDNGKQEPAPAWWPALNAEDPHGGSVAWAVHHANAVSLSGSPVSDTAFETRAVELIETFAGLFNWDGTEKEGDDLQEWLGVAIPQLQAWHAEARDAYVASQARVERDLGSAKDQVLCLAQFESAALDVLAGQPSEGPLYLVFPGPGGRQWMVQQVALQKGSFQGRKPLPESWKGLRDEAFQAITGVSDGVFCHPGRFICGAKSREGALRLAKLAVEAP